MSPAELKAIRLRLGLSQQAMGRALGYSGTPQGVRQNVMRYESGERSPIPLRLARLAMMYGKHGIPDDFKDRVQTPKTPRPA